MKISIRRPSPRPLVTEPVVAPEPLSQRRERNDLRASRAAFLFGLFFTLITSAALVAFFAELLFDHR